MLIYWHHEIGRALHQVFLLVIHHLEQSANLYVHALRLFLLKKRSVNVKVGDKRLRLAFTSYSMFGMIKWSLQELHLAILQVEQGGNDLDFALLLHLAEDLASLTYGSHHVEGVLTGYLVLEGSILNVG